MRIAFLTTDNREQFRQYADPMPQFGTAPEALLKGFERLPGIEVHVVSCARQPMQSSPEKLAENIWFHSVVVPKLGWMSTAYQGCIRAVRQKLSRIRPDVVHGQGTERDCSISAVYSGYPSVITIHGNMRAVARATGARPFSYLWLNAHLERFTIPRAAGVVCVTSYTSAQVAGLARTTWTVPNAIDASFYDVVRAPVAPPVILCVGLVCSYKNQVALIRALDSLAATVRFELLFLGDLSPSEGYDREFCDLLRARPWCRHVGFVERGRLQEHLQKAALLAHPSLEDNCPMVVLEAQAVGVPVAASRIGGIPDLIEAGRTGLLFDPRNPESIREAVAQMLNDSDSAVAMSARAKSEALSRFHPETVARRHVEIYREVLSSSS